MANLVETVERKAFGVAVDATLKNLNKDREKALLQIVDLTEKFMGNNFSKEAYDGARAMIKKPELVLFDEPFSDLDPLVRQELRRFVKEIHEQYGCTMVFVTHDLPEAFALADRILVLKEGRSEVVDTPRRLLEDPRSDLLAGFLGKMGGDQQDETVDK